jgi:ATP phosphoribosyltransferase regulatory subunit
MLPPVPTDYDGAALAAMGQSADAVLGVFARFGYARVEPPIIEPADVFIERSGEEIRRRLYIVSDPTGQELCLRPDLTIPVCRLFLRRGVSAPARLAYCGPAFRFEPPESGRPSQFLQAGIEALGHEDREAADAEILAACVEATESVGLDRATTQIQFGDLGLFHGFVDRLPVPNGWRARLRRHATRPDRLRAAIARLHEQGDDAADARRRAFLDALTLLDDAQAQRVVEEVLSLAEIAQSGGRSAAEIAERFLDQAGDTAAGGLPAELVEVIERYLKIEGTPDTVLKSLRDLIGSAGLNLDAEIGVFERRLDLLGRLGVAVERLVFSAEYRTTLRYYTGFTFRILAPDGEGAGCEIAGGGRYDDLLRLLGAPRELPAVGCAVHLDDLMTRVADTRARTP